MTKRIIYHIRSFAHRRVYESLEVRDGVDQIILGPKPKIMNGVLEGYDDFGIQNIRTYVDLNEAQKIVNQLKPDVFTQADFPNRINHPVGCKRVFIAHGMIGNHVISMFKKGTMSIWEDFDLYCGATNRFRDWIWHVTGKKPEVLTNAMPQLDLLTDPNYYMRHKSKVLASSKIPNPNATILFCGFGCKDRVDYNLHNEDFFTTIMELEKIAKKHNWLIMIKPRQNFEKAMKYLRSTGKWAVKYRTLYPKVINSPNLHFIEHENNIYRYFFADVVVGNGCSTIEVESCIAGRPLVMVRTKTGTEYDPFGTVLSGAAEEVKNVNHIESTVLRILGQKHDTSKQQEFLKSLGLTNDGLAHKRLQDRIILL